MKVGFLYFMGIIMKDSYLYYKEYTGIQKLLDTLKDGDQEPIIAGGCPRDIYLDRPFTDIDVFLAKPKKLLQVLNSLATLPIYNLRAYSADDMPVGYDISPHLTAVISFKYLSLDFQVILTTYSSTEAVVDNFGVNISKVYFEGRNIVLTPEAKADIENKTLTFTDALYHSTNYKEKIRKKFPGYTIKDSPTKLASIPF